MPKALVLGVNGQDGSYAAEALLKRGYDVVGAGRQPECRYITPGARYCYLQLNLENQAALLALLQTERPDVVFHTAAIHGAAGFKYEPVWESMLLVNVTSVHTVLEYARMQQPNLRLLYANSAKIFPTPWVGDIDEQTPIASTCLYSIGKIAALDLIRCYRKDHGIAAGNLILFNHESPRRPENFFAPRIARGLAKSIDDRNYRFAVHTLNFYADWSSAEELMDIAVDVIEQAPAEDFVFASGVTCHARAVVQKIFHHYGLDYTQHVVETLPSDDSELPFQVRLGHLERRIGRRPVRDFEVVVQDLVAMLRAA